MYLCIFHVYGKLQKATHLKFGSAIFSLIYNLFMWNAVHISVWADPNNLVKAWKLCICEPSHQTATIQPDFSCYIYARKSHFPFSDALWVRCRVAHVSNHLKEVKCVQFRLLWVPHITRNRKYTCGGYNAMVGIHIFIWGNEWDTTSTRDSNLKFSILKSGVIFGGTIYRIFRQKIDQFLSWAIGMQAIRMQSFISNGMILMQNVLWIRMNLPYSASYPCFQMNGLEMPLVMLSTVVSNNK